jgi:predicted glycosyltransferase
MREDIRSRAAKVKARFHHFSRSMEALIGLADVVVSMGGYNTICEILSLGKPSLVVPREEPRLEQRIRAEVFKRHGLIDYLPWSELSPEALERKVASLIADPGNCCQGIAGFTFTGLDHISKRLAEFRGLAL